MVKHSRREKRKVIRAEIWLCCYMLRFETRENAEMTQILDGSLYLQILGGFE